MPLTFQAWASHYSFMRFRKGSTHATCSECKKHKSLVQSLGHHLRARKMQQTLLYAHLQAQFADRCEYWRKRGESRCRGLQLVIITDDMDQGKFALPRHPVIKAKTFDSWSRPRLHVAATIAHVKTYLPNIDMRGETAGNRQTHKTGNRNFIVPKKNCSGRNTIHIQIQVNRFHGSEIH